jgi:molecular chaperone GrpE (heat shock protein)
MERSRIWAALAIAGLTISIVVAPGALRGRDQPTLEELKARVAKTEIAGRPALCLHIAERQLDAAEKLYAAGDSDKAGAALADVMAYAELDREYAIQAHKHEKQSEIAIRKMVRKLSDLKHTLTHDEQDQVQKTIDGLQRVRDDLLAAMFPKGVKQ